MIYSKFFGNPNGTKPEPQQSKLSFSKKATDAKKEAKDDSTKTKIEDDVKPKIEEDGEGDTKMTDENGHDEQVQVKQEERPEDERSRPEKTGRKKVSFANGDPPSKKRAASEEEEEDSDEEPPTKKQRKKPTTKAETQQHSKPIKKEQVDNEVKPGSTKQTAPGKGVQNDNVETAKPKVASKKSKTQAPAPAVADQDEIEASESDAQSEAETSEESEEERPEEAAKSREKVQTTLKSIGTDPYPDWKAGDPVPYAALCTTFSKIEMTTKRLAITAHCALFLRQVLRLTPKDLLPTVLLMLGKLAADYAGVELGIGESLIMKAIGETTGRSLPVIKADQREIGDLGLVAAKSRSNQPTMFKPKPLTIRAVHEGLMQIALVEGQGSQGRKVGGIKKLLSAADVDLVGKGKSGVDITTDKGGASESKFIVRTLEGKMRLGLAEKTILVALANAAVHHDLANKGKKDPSSEQIGKGELILKNVFK